MSQYLYKKGSLKSLKNTSMNLEENEVLQHAYEVSAYCILNYNIDGIGSALVEKTTIESIIVLKPWEKRACICKNSEYVIMSYSKLEEIMLSPDWIISDYTPDDYGHPIEDIMRKGKHATKEG